VNVVIRHARARLASPLILCLALFSSSASAGGIFLRVPGIPGESTHPVYTNMIECYTVGSSLSRELPVGLGGRETSKPVFEPLRCVKAIDKASVPLLTKMVNTDVLGDVTLYFVSDDYPVSPRQEIKLFNAILNGVSQAAAGSAPQPTETLSIIYDRIETTTYGVDGSSTFFCYDLKDAVAC